MRSRTFLQNFFIRSISSEGWDTAVAYAYNMQIYPLSKVENPDKTIFLDMSKTGYKAATAFDSEYFNLVNMLIQEEPTNDYDKNMIGIANDDIETLNKFIDENKIKWEQIVQSNDKTIIANYGVVGYPTTFLIDTTGVIIAKNLRATDSMGVAINTLGK